MRWCVYTVVFAAPFSKSISEIAIALGIALWILRRVLRADLRAAVNNDLFIPFAIFVLAVTPSLFNSAYPLLSVKALFTKVLKFVLFYFVIIEAIDTKPKLNGLFGAVLASAIVITLDGFIQHYITGVDILHHYPSFKARPHGDVDGFFRGFPTASFPFPNDLAAWILLIFFPIASVTIFGLKGKSMRYLTALTSSGLFYLFFLAKARGAWIGLIISTVYMALSKRKFWLILLVVAVIAIPFLTKMEMSRYIFEFGSVGDRMGMWTTGLDIFKQHPVIGNGLNTFFLKFKEFRSDEWKGQKGSYAHNCYLQMAADTGLVGLLAFAFLMFSYFYTILKNLRRVKDDLCWLAVWGSSIGVFAFLIHSFFDTNLYSLNLATLFWCAIGISQAILKISIGEGRKER